MLDFKFTCKIQEHIENIQKNKFVQNNTVLNSYIEQRMISKENLEHIKANAVEFLATQTVQNIVEFGASLVKIVNLLNLYPLYKVERACEYMLELLNKEHSSAVAILIEQPELLLKDQFMACVEAGIKLEDVIKYLSLLDIFSIKNLKELIEVGYGDHLLTDKGLIPRNDTKIFTTKLLNRNIIAMLNGKFSFRAICDLINHCTHQNGLDSFPFRQMMEILNNNDGTISEEAKFTILRNPVLFKGNNFNMCINEGISIDNAIIYCHLLNVIEFDTLKFLMSKKIDISTRFDVIFSSTEKIPLKTICNLLNIGLTFDQILCHQSMHDEILKYGTILKNKMKATPEILCSSYLYRLVRSYEKKESGDNKPTQAITNLQNKLSSKSMTLLALSNLASTCQLNIKEVHDLIFIGNVSVDDITPEHLGSLHSKLWDLC